MRQVKFVIHPCQKDVDFFLVFTNFDVFHRAGVRIFGSFSIFGIAYVFRKSLEKSGIRVLFKFFLRYIFS